MDNIYYKQFNRFNYGRLSGPERIPSIYEYLAYSIPQKNDRDKYFYELTVKEMTYYNYIKNIWSPLGKDLNPDLDYSTLTKYYIKDGVRDRD
jgi:hypothetical protein